MAAWARHAPKLRRAHLRVGRQNILAAYSGSYCSHPPHAVPVARPVRHHGVPICYSRHSSQLLRTRTRFSLPCPPRATLLTGSACAAAGSGAAVPWNLEDTTSGCVESKPSQHDQYSPTTPKPVLSADAQSCGTWRNHDTRQFSGSTATGQATSEIDSTAAAGGNAPDWDETSDFDTWDGWRYEREQAEGQGLARDILMAMRRVGQDPGALDYLAQQGVHVVSVAPAAPQAWLTLEAAVVAAAASGSCPVAALKAELSHIPVHVLPTPGPNGDRCQLALRSVGHTFHDPAINQFLAAVFASVTAAWHQGSATGKPLPRVRLSRYDLFHAHLVLGPHVEEAQASLGGRRVGQAPGVQAHQGLCLLLHCAETPAFDQESFPYMLGWCQEGSDVIFDPNSFDMRNVLWYSGQLAFLDAGVGTSVHNQLLWESTRPLRTVYESDLGIELADVNLLINTPELIAACPWGVAAWGLPRQADLPGLPDSDSSSDTLYAESGSMDCESVDGPVREETGDMECNSSEEGMAEGRRGLSGSWQRRDALRSSDGLGGECMDASLHSAQTTGGSSSSTGIGVVAADCTRDSEHMQTMHYAQEQLQGMNRHMLDTCDGNCWFQGQLTLWDAQGCVLAHGDPQQHRPGRLSGQGPSGWVNIGLAQLNNKQRQGGDGVHGVVGAQPMDLRACAQLVVCLDKDDND